MRVISVLMVILFLAFQPLLSLAETPPSYQAQKEHGWVQNGRPMPDSENIKSRNGFGAQLWLVSDNSIFKDWYKPQTPNLKVTNTAVRNKPIYLIFLLINPGLDTSSKANVSADLTVKNPDGSIYGHFRDVEIWQRDYPFPTNTIQLAIGNFDIKIEDKDQLGIYKIKALIKDHYKKVFFTLNTEFTAVEN